MNTRNDLVIRLVPDASLPAYAYVPGRIHLLPGMVAVVIPADTLAFAEALDEK